MTSQENFETEAKAVGERLALLLVAADLPNDVKAGFAAMIPEMTPEQLDRLIHILEANVHDTAVEENKQLGEAIQKAQSRYEREQQVAEKEALKELEEIESILNQAEG